MQAHQVPHELKMQIIHLHAGQACENGSSLCRLQCASSTTASLVFVLFVSDEGEVKSRKKSSLGFKQQGNSTSGRAAPQLRLLASESRVGPASGSDSESFLTLCLGEEGIPGPAHVIL